MRRAARIDANQPEIVQAFRDLGCSVLMLHQIGKGCPDALIGKAGRSVLVEIKDGAKSPSAQKLTPDEEKFHAEWKGGIFIVNSLAGVEMVERHLVGVYA